MKSVVIGAGQIARQHLACLSEIPGVEVAAVCDLSRSVAEAAADRFSIPKWYVDHKTLLDEIRPDVVHVTTPVTSHFTLGRDALKAGAHVIVEKPAATCLSELVALIELAKARNRVLVEDYNYLFNSQILAIDGLIADGSFGEVVHVEVSISLDFLGAGSPFADANAAHPAQATKTGAIGDFLPHVAAIAHNFVGPHTQVRTTYRKRRDDHPMPHDEFRALVNAERGTAALGVSAAGQPDTFYVRVDGTKMRAAANLFEPRFTTERVGTIAKPLVTFVNGRAEARQVRRAAYGGLWRKFGGGPGSYEGLWELLKRTYGALQRGEALPVTQGQVLAVNRLVEDLADEAYAL